MEKINTKVEFIKLFSKRMRTHDGKAFNTYYAYIGTYDETSKTFITAKNKSNKDMSIRVHLCEPILSILVKDNKFPYLVTLDPTIKVEGLSSYYTTIDKDRDGVARLDKNGKSHHILIIKQVKSYSHIDLEQSALIDVCD